MKIPAKLHFRSFLAAAGVLAVALGLAVPAVSAAEIDFGHEKLLQHGLQIQAWAYPGDTLSFNLTQWAESNFSTVTLNSGTPPAYLGPAPGVMWATARWPRTLPTGSGPYVPNLVSYQYGDEQDMTDPATFDKVVAHLAEIKARYPEAIVHTNQLGNQLDPDLMHRYMSAAQPHMLMFDAYPFNGIEDYVPGGSPLLLYSPLEKVRAYALSGNDGTGRQPIPFGMYLQNHVTQEHILGHEVTESEMHLNQFIAWAYGCKLVSSFLYTSPVQDIRPVFFEDLSDAHPTAQFYYAKELNRQSRNIGPALVRLLSTDVRFVVGRHKRTPDEAPRSITMPGDTRVWNATVDPYMKALSATNLSAENYGLEGNVIIGYYKVLDEDLDGPRWNGERYFMLVNGLSAPGASGTAANTRQRIHAEFDFGASGITDLLRISRETGQIEPVPLTPLGGTRYALDLDLDGGTGDLFKYNTGAPFVGDPTYGGHIVSNIRTFTVEGDPMTLQTIRGAQAYQWLLNGVPIADDGRITGATTRQLTVSSLLVADSGTYRCQLTYDTYAKALTHSEPLTVDVIPAGGLPLSNRALPLLAACFAAVGILALRTRRRA